MEAFRVHADCHSPARTDPRLNRRDCNRALTARKCQINDLFVSHGLDDSNFSLEGAVAAGTAVGDLEMLRAHTENHRATRCRVTLDANREVGAAEPAIAAAFARQ